MSVKNKAKDRNTTGRIRSKYTAKTSKSFTGATPSWWINLTMNRPKRRVNKKLCDEINSGANPDELVFPVGNRKPHHYYW